MKRTITTMLLVIAACFTLTGCFGVIDQGNVGVRTQFGSIDPKPVTGTYTSFFSSVDEYTTKETNVTLENMKPRAADNLTLEKLDVVVYYSTRPDKIPNFQATFGGQSAQLNGDSFYRPGYVLVEATARGATMDAVSKMDSLTVHANRQALQDQIQRELQTSLDKQVPGTFTVTRVMVTSVETDPSIEQSIRDNVTAGKRLDTAKKLVAVKEQEALANQQIAQTLTPEFLQHEYNQAIASCATSDKCTLIVDGSSGGTQKLVNVKP